MPNGFAEEPVLELLTDDEIPSDKQDEPTEESAGEVTPIHPVDKIFVHQSLDLDAGVPAAILQCVGGRLFPGAKEAEVTFHGKLPMTLQEMKDAHAIALDFGWKNLTEEERQDPEAKFYVIDHHYLCPDKSTTLMLAEILGIEQSEIWKNLIDYVTMHDLEGTAVVTQSLRNMEAWVPPEILRQSSLQAQFSLAAVLSIRRDGDKKAYEFIRGYVSQYHKKQMRFYGPVAREFKEKVQKRWLRLSNGQRVSAAVLESGVDGVAAYARHRKGGQCQIVIQRFPSGNTIIHSNQWGQNPRNLLEPSNIIQVKEMQRRQNNQTFTPADLAEGELCDNWHLAKHRSGFVYAVLNGSRKHEVEATVLGVEEIITTLKWGLDPMKFHESCPKDYCLGASCPFFAFFLKRCHTIRVKAHQV